MMCKFCDAVLEEKRMMLWQRSTMATDNLYDTKYELNNYESVYDYSNFCPCCGKQLSKNINNTKYDNYIEIIE